MRYLAFAARHRGGDRLPHRFAAARWRLRFRRLLDIRATSPRPPGPCRRPCRASTCSSAAALRAAGETARRPGAAAVGAAGDVTATAAAAAGAGTARSASTCALTCSEVSLASRSTAITVPTGISAPGSTSSSSTVPSCQHSTSIAALVVSTTATMSPFFTWSPGSDAPLEQRALVHVGAERRQAKRDHGERPQSTRAAAAIRPGMGSAASSRCFGYGIGTSALHTRTGGASSS